MSSASSPGCRRAARVLLLGGLCCFGLPGLTSAQAVKQPSSDSLALCQGPNSSLDERMTGCTAMIDAGREAGRTLAIAHCNRGHVFNERGDYDRAIADLDQAIKADAGYACSWNNRARAMYRKALALQADFPPALDGLKKLEPGK